MHSPVSGWFYGCRLAFTASQHTFRGTTGMPPKRGLYCSMRHPNHNHSSFPTRIPTTEELREYYLAKEKAAKPFTQYSPIAAPITTKVAVMTAEPEVLDAKQVGAYGQDCISDSGDAELQANTSLTAAGLSLGAAFESPQTQRQIGL